ncbi:putative metal ion transporter [Colletotrichum spaethianum]|uniref:Metal ion transporter n=1 Tax=Colletotrichum spaethianum TaxID=700344 RepID=A0AA37LC05_9PEZI|nr:putative metal ion transporter [Colletotrichum spaethianum]GKT43800.1 putative metal ion transporter [Colletotrichum spaethianum]
MSDHEENTSEGVFKTPIPELDDHRHQIAASPHPERPRRGTFDTLYGARLLGPESVSGEQSPSIRVRDFEEAIVDDEGGDVSPSARRVRRPTVETTTDQRSVSPPNSVKAFAEARRRERGMSFSESKAERNASEEDLHRTVSISSRRSLRSRPYTADDGASLATNQSAAEDVCFPLQDPRRKDQLYIDFDYLENFIHSDRASRTASRRDSARSFPDLRQQLTSDGGPPQLQLSTVDGDILNMPSDSSVGQDTSEKEKEEDTPIEEVKAKPAPAQQPLDPNRFSFFSSAWESTIHAAELGDLVLPGEDLRGLFALPADESDGVWWLNVNSPTKEEVTAICKAFGIHPLTIEDITTQEAREKIELFPSYYFASFRSFHAVQEDDGLEYEPYNLYVVVFREGTLSFSFEPNAHASHVRKRIALLKDYVALSSDWICYALIDDIVDCFAPVIRDIELEADAIEDGVFVAREDDSNQFLRSIGRVRKNTMALMRLLGGKADVLRGFTKRCNENYKVTPRMDIGLYLGDIQDHVVTMVTNLGHFEKILSRSHSNYLAQLSINSISQGTHTNLVLSKITFLASILVPLNLVCGLFGMNVAVPFQDSKSLAPFFTILGTLIIFSIVSLTLARKYKYI